MSSNDREARGWVVLLCVLWLPAACSGGVAPELPDGGCLASRNDLPECSGAECATDERAAHLLDLWWQVLLETLDAPEDVVRATIAVMQAQLIVGMPSVFFRVDYVVHVGWVVAHQNTTVDLGEAPLDPFPDDATVLDRIRRLGHMVCTHLPRSAITAERTAALAVSCSPFVDLSNCNVWALNPSDCAFGAGFFGVIDRGTNRCVSAAVDLEAGRLTDCRPMECAIE
jgi:hypothetical protein